MKKRIVLAGLKYEWNLGDEIIYECVKFLLEKILKDQGIDDVEIVEIDLRSKVTRDSCYIMGEKYRQFYNKMLSKIEEKEKKREKDYSYNQYKFFKKYAKVSEYYYEYIGKADAIIVSGGGLIKYKYQELDYIIENLIYYATRNHIPVFMNALGVEGYSEDHFGCQRLKKYINMPCVRMITTRDNEDLLVEKWLYNKNIVHGLVGDPALWAPELYHVKKKESNIIGLGLIRDEIFKVNGVQYEGEEFLKLWKEIIAEIEKRGYRWKFFLNGKGVDVKFAEKLIDYLGYKKEEVLMIPHSAEELVQIISGFQGVIACRLHAAIVSYALDIPNVGIVWNEKQTLFGKIIGKPENFITIENFNAEKIVKRLEDALNESYDSCIREKLKMSTEQKLTWCIKKIEEEWEEKNSNYNNMKE